MGCCPRRRSQLGVRSTRPRRSEVQLNINRETAHMNVRSISIMIVATAIFAVSEAADSVKAEPAKDSGATATLTGVVKLEGTAPKAAPISMTKEPTCAK